MKGHKGSPAQGLFGATLGFFLGFAAVSLFGPTAYKFKEAMDLNPVMLGLLVAIPSLSGSLLRIPFGAWADTAGARKPFLVLLTMSFLGMLSLFLVLYFLYPDNLGLSYYPLLLLLGVLCGCGIANFIFLAYLPFTKLVYVFSYPFAYVTRPYISMRSYMGLKR